MSLSINTNVSALVAHQNMLTTDNEMNTSLERLSTGLRINKAADDASGMTIADSLKAQYLGIGQGIQNANEGVSIVQIADGALEESINIVNTIKSKAIQAASDGQTAETRAAIQADIDKLLDNLDTIAKTTSYNGQQLLNGGFTGKELQIGASANQTAAINIGSTQSTQTGHVSTATLALDNKDGGEIKLTITSAISGEEVELEAIEILMDSNSAANGMGALADEINSQTYLTGVSATAVVKSTTAEAIQAGSTGDDFSINGVRIGAVDVLDNDSKEALVTAINDQTTETGVIASRNQDGTLSLTSEDGRAILVQGDTGKVFGDQTADDMSTIGYITLTQAGSSQFNIEGTTNGSLQDDFTLTANLTTFDDATLAAGSEIAVGSTLAAGTVVGGDATLTAAVTNTTGEYELAAGSELLTGSVLGQGTTLGGTAEVGGAATSLNLDSKITAGSVLETGSVLKAGTTLTFDFSDGGVTYTAGTTLSTDLTLASSLSISTEMTLAKGSELAVGSTLEAGSFAGADIALGADMNVDEDMTLGTGSTLADNSVLAAGSTIGHDTTVDDGAGGAITTTQETNLAAGSTLAADSVLGEGSEIEQAMTVDAVTLSEATILKAGSVLEAGTTLAAGTVLTEDMALEDSSGTVHNLKAGDILNEDLDTTAQITLSKDLILAKGSALAADSVVKIDTDSAGNLDLSGQEGLTLSDINVMTQEDAQIAIEIADAALADLDATRSDLGSVQNQLTSTIANLSVTKTNVQSAESTIRDVDFAEETANFTRLQLLAQTSSYAMTQANANSQNVLSLLK
ncbi:flagellin [Desulfospira joergensenii]|uniref:flagellin N-terminal helical domain-containing protein n=1 Tax=Desulfospira joergensenii TaxID=53329 RepID=UPI0003B4AFAB|nr:flagellin [Desulfospira joergensenii]